MTLVRIPPILLVLLLAVGGCALNAAGAREPNQVVFAVRNGAQASLDVEVCGPVGCTDPQRLRPGQQTRIAMALSDTGYRYNLTAKYPYPTGGYRVVLRRSLDIMEAGTVRIVLNPGDPVP